VHKGENTEELTEFREYLLKKNMMDDFKEYAIIEKSNDPVVNNFFVKYNIMAMYIEPGH
jgi:hypothetical protein